MKADIHPQYKDVVFQDVTSNFAFLTRSTLHSKDTIVWEDGKKYPLMKVEVSSASHPFYTGKIGGDVLKHNVFVLGMDIGFHGEPTGFA